MQRGDRLTLAAQRHHGIGEALGHADRRQGVTAAEPLKRIQQPARDHRRAVLGITIGGTLRHDGAHHGTMVPIMGASRECRVREWVCFVTAATRMEQASGGGAASLQRAATSIRGAAHQRGACCLNNAGLIPPLDDAHHGSAVASGQEKARIAAPHGAHHGLLVLLGYEEREAAATLVRGRGKVLVRVVKTEKKTWPHRRHDKLRRQIPGQVSRQGESRATPSGAEATQAMRSGPRRA